MSKLTNREVRLRCIEVVAHVRFTDAQKLVNYATVLEQFVLDAKDEPDKEAEEKLSPEPVSVEAIRPEANEAPKRRGRPPKADKA